MNEILENITDINRMIVEGNAQLAFEKYYADSIEMQENQNTPIIGKKNNLEREIQFFKDIGYFTKAIPLRVTANENTTMVEWNFEYTHRVWGYKNYHQISVQSWENGKIVKERFYYSH